MASETLAVIDFETTGLSPAQGARATEIAAVLVRDGAIVARYQSLMRSEAWVSPFIEQLTGISNAMLRDAPAAEQVMAEVCDFVAGCGIVAHNASFDRGFWAAEAQRVGRWGDDAPAFACTVLLARRLYPEARRFNLGALAGYFDLPSAGRAHRALADAEVTAQLVLRMQRDVERRYPEAVGERGVTHDFLLALQRSSRQDLTRSVARYCEAAGHRSVGA